MKKILLTIFAALTAWMSLLAPLGAEEPAGGQPAVPPWNRLYLSSLTIARYNPLGLETQNRLMYSRRLFDSQSVLFRDTFLALGPSVKLNPAYVKAGGLLDFQPIAIFNVRFGYEFVDYFGTFGYLQSYTEPDADYSDDARADTEDSAYSTSGHHYFVEPTLQMKVGKIVLRTKFAFEYWNVDLSNRDNYFYDATLDTLVPVKNWIWTNDTDLIYMSGRLVVGARFSGVFPDNDGNRHMRVGPIIAWSFNTDDYTRFNKPTLLCILGWYLEHPNREGGIPYVLVGYSFSSDLL